MSDFSRLSAALADRYRIERELGTGGMATVYLAHDLRHDRDVAIKVLHEDLGATLGPERFLAEIKTTARLQHPHILPLLDSGDAGGLLFYVMPYVAGETLRERLTRDTQLSIDDAVRIAREIADALGAAHALGIIHRDIKPENILLQGGHALVADFGIALAVQQAGGSRLTQTGLSLGTPQYMAPEQAMGEKTIDLRADVYALGAVLYEMLAGEPPFTGPTVQTIVARILTEKPASIRAVRDTVPEHVERAVMAALAKLPADRLASAEEFSRALHVVGTSAGEVTHVPPAPRSLVSRLALPLGLAIVGVVLGFLIGGRTNVRGGAFANDWRGELLGGPRVALSPRPSSDGQLVVFGAMVDGQTQVGVLRSTTGEWKVLTNDRTRGLAQDFAWSADNGKIYYSRFFEVPKGIYSISPLGTGDRLILADAGAPDVLPDGSLLVARVNAQGQLQMYRYWPETAKLDTLPAIAATSGDGSFDAFFRAFPDGREAAFIGRRQGQRDSADALYAIDLTSRKIRPLAPGLVIPSGQLAIAAGGRAVVVNSPVGNESRFVTVPRDGSNRIEVFAVLTAGISNSFDLDHEGNFYFSQGLRPASMWRYDPSTRSRETWPISADGIGTIPTLPLPDGRVARSISTSGGRRIMVSQPGTDEQPFMAVEQQTRAPMALIGTDQVALMLGPDTSLVAAVVSLQTGQLVNRLPGIHPAAMAGSPDGRVLYYIESKVVWAIPAQGGAPRKIRDGVAVAVDPGGKYLVVEALDRASVRLFRVPLDGTPETEIGVHSTMRLGAGVMAPNAIGSDGRIVLTVISPASWYWPLAILDQKTGKLDLVPPESGYDTFGGWDNKGRIVFYAQGQESSLWRFRPISTKGRAR